MSTHGGPVVAAVDGSAASPSAVDLAVREPTLRRCALRAVHAFILPYLYVSLDRARSGRRRAGSSTTPNAP